MLLCGVGCRVFSPRICDVLADIYINPKLTPKEIERERGVIGRKSSCTATSRPRMCRKC